MNGRVAADPWCAGVSRFAVVAAPAHWRARGPDRYDVDPITASSGDNGNGNPNEIWAQRFDATGAVDGAALQLATISRPRWRLEPFGNEYFLAYSGQEIGGTPIASSVLTLSAAGAVTAEYEPFTDGNPWASAGGNSDQMLVSWQDATTEGLWGRLLSKADGWGEPFVLTEQVAEGVPAICWDTEAFVVVWGEDRTALWSRDVSPDGSLSEAERLFTGDYG